MSYIVEIENGVWLAPWRGDPGRTLVLESAKKFDSEVQAKSALLKAKKHRDFNRAKITIARDETL